MSKSALNAAFALVDWGTTNLRVWLVDHQRQIIAETTTADGMGSLTRDQFEPVLENALSVLGADDHLPVMMCGMAGSRQGWREAPYAACPVALNDLAAHAIQFTSGNRQMRNRQVRILPGVARKDKKRPDVMRGEETQLLGLSATQNLSDALVCLPGTHSKWVKLDQGTITDFVSVMTGELYALLRSQSILRHSTGDTAKVSAADPVFLEHVQTGLSSTGGLGRLFSIRAASLVGSATPEVSTAALSGLLIGTEIRDASAILAVKSGDIHIVGSGALSQLYRAALSISGFTPVIQDGAALVRAGLLSAASSLKNATIRAAE